MFKRIAIGLSSVLAAFSLLALPVSVNAQSLTDPLEATQTVCDGLNNVSGASGNCQNDNSLNRLVRTTISILSWLVGVASVIVIILSGYKYITSAGDAAKVKSAKGTLIYAMVGLAIAALGQFIVYFVLTEFS